MEDLNLNKDNIINIIPRVSVKTKQSQKTQKNYTMLDIKFVNGYVLSVFLTNEQKFILKSLVDSQNKQSLTDKEFDLSDERNI